MANPTRNLIVRFIGDTGDLTRGLDGITGRFRAVSSGLGGIATIGAAIGAVSFFKTMISEAEEAAKTGRQTEAVLKSTGGAAKLTAAQIGDLAQSLSAKVGIDDEVIQSGENVLLTFTRVRNEVGEGNDVFSQATGLALDMSAAMGTDLQSSIIQVGKALNDPIQGITALQRVGVTFTAQQKDEIKALVEKGDVLGAQKIILGELRTEFGGMAEASASSTDKLKVAFGNIAEQLGGLVLPYIERFANWINDKVVPNLSAWLDKIKPLVEQYLGALGDRLKDVLDVVGPIFKTMIDGFGAVLGFLNSDDFNNAPKKWADLTIALGAVGGAVWGIEKAQKAWNAAVSASPIVGFAAGAVVLFASFKDDIGRIFGDENNDDSIIGKIGRFHRMFADPGVVSDALKHFFGDVVPHWAGEGARVFAQNADELWNYWSPRIGGALDNVGGMFNGWTTNTLIPWLGGVGDWFQGLPDRLNSQWLPAIGGVFGGFGGILHDWFTNTLVPWLGGVGDWFQGLPDRLNSQWLPAIGGVFGGFGGILNDWFTNTLIPWLGNVGGWFQSLPDRLGNQWLPAIGGVFSGFGGLLRDWIDNTLIPWLGNVVGWFQTLPGKLLTVGGDMIGGLRDGMIQAADAAWQWIKGIGEKIVNAVKDFFGIHSPSTVFADLGRNMLQGLINGLMDGNPTDIVKKIFGSMEGALQPLVLGNFIDTSDSGNFAKIAKFLGGLFGDTGFGIPGAGVRQWSGTVLQVLKMLGQPASLLPKVLRRMEQESGGNPLAYNNWDSNALAGNPSKGLMQTTGTTFDSYAGPFRGLGIFNPLANIYAGLNYAIQTYPSLAYAMDKPGGYAKGGWFMPGQLGYNETREPEAILNKTQWNTLAGGRRGGMTITGDIHIHTSAKLDEQELVRIFKSIESLSGMSY